MLQSEEIMDADLSFLSLTDILQNYIGQNSTIK